MRLKTGNILVKLNAVAILRMTNEQKSRINAIALGTRAYNNRT